MNLIYFLQEIQSHEINLNQCRLHPHEEDLAQDDQYHKRVQEQNYQEFL
ncbi:uncharacterized protein METZ01_LOCUS209180 [marine metagenome]|uniref:Uncharacterized protein n=1 Tax=marine metagenome TaxID=408172 RepID=A0A382F004_9ZZZZ